MEKFFIVTNETFLKEIEDFYKNEEVRREFVKDFMTEHGIAGSGYYLHGSGSINVPFKERNKGEIVLYIDDNKENEEKFGKELRKAIRFDNGVFLRPFKKASKTLKEFQDLCIEKEIVINSWWHREGDWFEELRFGGYTTTRFEYQGKYYLRMETKHSGITPIHDGFNEIKGSEYYLALEGAEKERFSEV